MKRFISFSGGVESTTMCILYGKGAKAIFCDTGAEHKEMYERLDYVENMLKVIHDGDFGLIRIKPEVKARGVVCNTIEEYALQYNFLPSKQERWCTKYFKIIPIDNFLKEQGECELFIGLNADEEPGEDRTGNFMKCKNVHYRYPLYEEGKTRDDCKDVLFELGLLPQFPVYMARGGCKWCPFKAIAEYKAMYYFDRSTFDEGSYLEKRIQDKRGKFYAISMSMKSFADIAAECEREKSLWGEVEIKRMYKEISNTKSCGAFCHR